jgi:serine/threonine protein kinase
VSEPALDDDTDDGLLVIGTPVGEYISEQFLGSGGFAKVYQGRHPTLGTRVALKVLDRMIGIDHESMQRFTREAQAANRIDHPSVVKVLGFGKLPDGRAYQVMELVEGPSLDEHIAKHGNVSVEVALQLLTAIADALAAAHSLGIVHRDLKPSNILISKRGGQLIPRLTDFGIAKAIDREEDSKLTRTGSTLGTPFYMSPEQALGSKIGAQSDIYGFGVVAFELLTGQVPFNGESPFAVMMKHVQATPPLPSDILPALGSGFDQAITKMLSKRAEQRQATISEAMHDLKQAAAAPMSNVHKATSPASKVARWKWAIAAVMILVVTGGSLAWRATASSAPEITTSTPPTLNPASPALPDSTTPTAIADPKPVAASTSPVPTKPSPKKRKPDRSSPAQTAKPDSDSFETPPGYTAP